MKLSHRIAVLFLTVIIVAGGYFAGYLLGRKSQPTVVAPVTTLPTGVQLASQMTVLCPSYLTYADQTRIEKGTGLEGVDFIYVERQTGIDAVTLMAIAAHESSWGNNSWAKRYNNVMSWGISDSDPDRAYYDTKTANVLAAAKGLKRLYLSEDATYYGGDLTLYGVNKYYASDKGWAAGVLAIVKQIEAKLTQEQQMKRWCVKVGLFAVPVTWDEVTKKIGWSFYKMNQAPAIAGR